MHNFPLKKYSPNIDVYKETDFVSQYSKKLGTTEQNKMEMSGIEPEAFRMRNGRSTTELHPRGPKIRKLQKTLFL
jgi:hypothetical protein